MFNEDLLNQAARLIAACAERGRRIATAESCTGGLLAGLLTEVPGSSAVVERGFVTYSNLAKTQMIGVDAHLIERLGAVSAEVARAMALGALAASQATLALSITGIAGPGGGSAQKPVGLVFLACAREGRIVAEREARFGDLGRAGVRLATLAAAVAMLLEAA